MQAPVNPGKSKRVHRIRPFVLENNGAREPIDNGDDCGGSMSGLAGSTDHVCAVELLFARPISAEIRLGQCGKTTAARPAICVPMPNLHTSKITVLQMSRRLLWAFDYIWPGMILFCFLQRVASSVLGWQSVCLQCLK